MSKQIHEKLDKIVERIGSIDVTLAKQEVQLEEHIRRTNMLEAKFEPVERHVAYVNGGIKLLGIILTLVTIYSLLF